MTYEDFVSIARRAFDAAQSGDVDGGIKIFQDLVQSDLPSKDKAYMCLNVAALFDSKGDKTTALEWFGKGVEYDTNENGWFAKEQRAAYLAGMGKVYESISDFNDILKHPGLTDQDKDRIKQNITFLQAKMD